MNHIIRPVFRICLALVLGVVVTWGLLLALRSLAVASPVKEQPVEDIVLWLTPPETRPAPGPWSLVVESHQSGWQAQSAIVKERLAVLKAQGHVSAFKPLAGSVGFTVSAPAGLPPEVRHWPEVVRITASNEATPQALAAWWRQGLEAASAIRSAPLGTQQATTLTLNLGLHSYLVSGSTPRPEPITFSLTRDGAVIASTMATPVPDGSGGYLYAATLYLYYYGGGEGSCYYPAIEPGDVLEAVQASRTVSLTVPLLSALADQDSATVYGQAPPAATLKVYLYRYVNTSVAYQQTVTATAGGDYQVDFSGLTPLRPRDYGYVFHANEAGNHVYVRYNVPFLRVGIEEHRIEGVVAPLTTITATLHEDTGILHGQTYGCSGPDGVFNVYSYPAPQVGDTLVVTAAQVISMTVPILTARLDPKNDVVSGEAPAGAALQVDLYKRPLEFWYTPDPPSYGPDYSLSVTATVTGTFVADFTGLADVDAGDYCVVYLTDAAGYQTYHDLFVPFLQARLGDYWLTGQVAVSGPITITVLGGSGIPRDVRSAWASDDGYFSDQDWDRGLRLLAGDHVTVTTQGGEEIGLTLPSLTAYADLASSTVQGQAPPNSRLRVGFSRTGGRSAGGGEPYPSQYEYTLWVTSTVSGAYTADFSNLTIFRPGDRGAVFYLDPEGYEVFLEFIVPIVRVQSGSNHVAGVLPAESKRVAVTLRDAWGRVKATDTTRSLYRGSFEVRLLQQNWQPAIIEAGDIVEVVVADASIPFLHNTVTEAASDLLITVIVPTLTVQADLVADVLSGQAPPNAPLEVTWRGGDGWDGLGRTWVITSTESGTYALDLSGEVDVERGDRIEVAWTDENSNQIWRAYHIPRLQATLGRDWVSVYGPIYSPVTLTLLSTSGAPLDTVTGTLDDSGRATFYLYDQKSYTPLYLEADQTLVADLAGETMTMTLPHLTAWADPQTDTISGEAPPGARLFISAGWWPWWPVTATVTGTYRIDFSGLVDIRSDSSGAVVYLHPDGHRIRLEYAVPHIEVTLGEADVSGVAAGPGRVTVTLRDADGVFKGSGSDDAQYGNQFWIHLTDAQEQPAPVTGGDVVSLEAVGRVTTFTVPTLTASFERRTGILAGTAPARAWLRITLGEDSRQMQVGSDGTYAMDWSDLVPRPGERGYLIYTDNLGNRTQLRFTVPYYIYFPLVSRTDE